MNYRDVVREEERAREAANREIIQYQFGKQMELEKRKLDDQANYDKMRFGAATAAATAKAEQDRQELAAKTAQQEQNLIGQQIRNANAALMKWKLRNPAVAPPQEILQSIIGSSAAASKAGWHPEIRFDEMSGLFALNGQVQERDYEAAPADAYNFSSPTTATANTSSVATPTIEGRSGLLPAARPYNPPPMSNAFNSEAEARAAGFQNGDIIMVGGRRAQLTPD